MASRAVTVRMLQRAALPYRRHGFRVERYEDGILTLVRRHNMNPLLFLVTLPWAFLFGFAQPRDERVLLTVIGGRVVARGA